MPDRRPPSDVPERIEWLSRALDRVAADQPTPVLDDPELQELVDLAVQLRLELPRDLIDPVFRSELKSQLNAPPRRDQRRGGNAPPRPAAFPYRAAVGAIAAVFVAAVAVGSLAIWMNSGNKDDSLAIAPANRTIQVNPTQPLGQVTATSLSATLVSVTQSPQIASALTPATLAPATTVTPAVPQSTSTAQVARATTTSASSTTISATATRVVATSALPTPTSGTNPTAEPTDGTQLAVVPPVDSHHLEPGPVPAADGGGEPPSTAVVITLDTSLPDLSDTAPVYTLSPPDVDPSVLVAGVAAVLGIDGPVVKATDARNNVQYRADGSNGANFVWTPGTGGFLFSLPDFGTPTPTSGDVTAQQAVDNTLAWLDSIGYPADSLDAPPLATLAEDGVSWSVELWTQAVPYNSFGHPLGVKVSLNPAGQVTGGTGFWLMIQGQEDVPILSSDDAWTQITARKGYWTGGGIASGGGTLDVDTMFLGYTLTREDDGGDLIYQPTVIVQGAFIATNGDSTRITVYLQATK